MTTKHVIGTLLLLTPLALAAQEAKKPEVKGELTVEGRKVDVDPASAKFNEYSDTRNSRPLTTFGIEVQGERGYFFDFQGENMLRKDQSLRASAGLHGMWRIVAERNETPHNLSFKAMTPFRNRGNGLFTVDSIVPIPNKVLAPTAAQLLPNDAATAAWVLQQVRPTELGTQRDKTGTTLSLTPTEFLKLRMTASNELKQGSKLGYGVIGDRPPRSLAAQMAQPIDYKSTELLFEAEYNKPKYQAFLSYTVSKFDNGIEVFRWQNPYATPGASFDQWSGHRVATFGQSPLAPDNTYQHANASFGINLPWSSRLTVAAAFGKMKQDQALLPYATSNFGRASLDASGNALADLSSPAALPRKTAQAEISTTRFNLDYTVNPLPRLNLRAYARVYDLENSTPTSNWWYVTSDTMPGSATATVTNPIYVNQRKNHPYSIKEQNTGLEGSTFFSFWRTSLALNLDQAEIERTGRESHRTKETTLKLTARSRPTSWLSLRAKALMGNRDAGHYEYDITRESYWYNTMIPGPDNNNPGSSFDNHPDMRKYDVSDRKRDEFVFAVTLNPVEALDVSLNYRTRMDDFDSHVTPVQPLLNNLLVTNPADKNAWTAGNQIGLLKNDGRHLTLNVSYAVDERLTFNLFAGRDTIELTQRGMEFNENNRLNPSSVAATTELGPWTRATSQWMSVSTDKTTSYGMGLAYDLISNKLLLSLDYALSDGTVDIAYSGFGVASSANPANNLPDNHEFAFRTPTTVRNKQSSLHARLTYTFSKSLSAGLAYRFEQYDLSDWMQEKNQPWFESVGSEYFLRDTSSATSTQWGNRLINLGSYLAPAYKAHYVSLSAHYRF